jgi:AmmeMemoRadiSam system protein B
MSDLRPSPIAGTWYPGAADSLSRSVDAQLESAEVGAIPGKIVGVIVPHAGHRYSGHIAGQAFHVLRGLKPTTVAVLSPLHHPYPVRIASTGHKAYQTPLGSVPVDQELLAQVESHLKEHGGITLKRIFNDQEHSLEIELPFLQRALPEPFRLLPLMLRDQSEEAARAVAQALGAVLSGTETILVGSTDLSHFYPENVARVLDAEVLRRIEAFDPAGLLSAEEEGKGYACGKGAAAAVLWAAKELGADAVKLLAYGTSGDITGDRFSVVGYGAAVIYQSGGHGHPS